MDVTFYTTYTVHILAIDQQMRLIKHTCIPSF